MVKAYLRYEQAAAWGVVATGLGDTAGALTYVPASSSDDVGGAAAGARERLAVAALERVGVWDVKRAQRERQLIPPNDPDEHGVTKAPPRVTCVARSPTGEFVASGGSDGSVRLWSLAGDECDVTFRGHKRDVTTLRFSRPYTRGD